MSPRFYADVSIFKRSFIILFMHPLFHRTQYQFKIVRIEIEEKRSWKKKLSLYELIKIVDGILRTAEYRQNLERKKRVENCY